MSYNWGIEFNDNNVEINLPFFTVAPWNLSEEELNVAPLIDIFGTVLTHVMKFDDILVGFKTLLCGIKFDDDF